MWLQIEIFVAALRACTYHLFFLAILSAWETSQAGCLRVAGATSDIDHVLAPKSCFCAFFVYEFERNFRYF